jgi:hypothetical protein
MGERRFLLQQIKIVRGYRRHDCLLIEWGFRLGFRWKAASPVVANLVVAI